MWNCSGSEADVRKQWLWCTAILNGMITQYMLGMYAVYPHGIHYTLKMFVEPGQMLINSLLFFPLTYYFAFKKRGWRWLALCLIAGPLAMLSFGVHQFQKETDTVGLAIFTLGFLFNVALYIPWYALSLKVVALNRSSAKEKIAL